MLLSTQRPENCTNKIEVARSLVVTPSLFNHVINSLTFDIMARGHIL
jgi:hypothetical protein